MNENQIIVAAEIATTPPTSGTSNRSSQLTSASSRLPSVQTSSWGCRLLTRGTRTTSRWRASSAAACRCSSRPNHGCGTDRGEAGARRLLGVHAPCACDRPRAGHLQETTGNRRAGVRADQTQPQVGPVPNAEADPPSGRSGGSQQRHTTCSCSSSTPTEQPPQRPERGPKAPMPPSSPGTRLRRGPPRPARSTVYPRGHRHPPRALLLPGPGAAC